VRTDDYAWLKPANWKEVWRDTSVLDPQIRAWLATENAYADAVLAPTKPLQAALLAEMTARTAPEQESPPRLDSGFAYLTRFSPGAQYPRHLRRPPAGGPETLLLDEQARAAGHAFFRIVGAGPSPDHRLFAWAEDVAGAEKYVIYVKPLATGLVIDAPKDAFGSFALTPDGAWLFWTFRDASSRPSRIYRRPARGGPDVLVYEEPDPAFLLTVTLSSSGKYLFLRSWNDVTSEVRVIQTDAPTAAPRLIAAREAGHLYTLEHWDDRFVVLTNSGGAVDFKLMQAPLAAPERTNWRDWIPEQRGRTLTDVRAFAGRLVRVERIEGDSALIIRAADGRDLTVAFDEPAYVLTLEPSPYDGRTLRLAYESPRTPKTWFALDLLSGQRAVVAAQPVPKFQRGDYEVRRIHAGASDGSEIPITLLHRKGLKLDGKAPLMLTGYGSYGADYETGFSIPNLSLVDRGWVWAAAHVRGGSEKGRDWFEQARQLKKKISFSDFIACAEHLITARYTARKRIVLHGFSAGGLLTGAALNLRPDLFGAVIGQAPFVDMLNTMSDATHPLVPLTRPVWGDPHADTAAYDYIASYSPYENVAAKPYPPVLATTAIGDDRVGFWEPAKWIAALREKSTSGAPMVLHTEMSGAHAGAGGRFDEMAQVARMYAFALAMLAAKAT
jgi:oligopeptidase B